MSRWQPAQTAIPYSASTLIALEAEHFAAIQRTVALLFRLAHSPAYQALLDADAEPLLRHSPGNFGVFMGYDFHLTPDGPRLIEVNTNAGGALLNGLHTASLCDPEKLACLCADLLPVETLEQKIVETFAAELAAVRGPAARLAHVAIADDRPREQFLYPEFELFQTLFARAGIEARIADTRALAPAPGGGVALDDWPVDLVYLRDTDFALASERTRVLREAYLANSVVVTPSPREHFLLADKRRLALFSSERRCASSASMSEDARFLALGDSRDAHARRAGRRGRLAQPRRMGLQAGGGVRQPGGLPGRQDLPQEVRQHPAARPATSRSAGSSPDW